MRGTRPLMALVVVLGLSGVSLSPADGARATGSRATERAAHGAVPEGLQEDDDRRVLADDVVRPATRSTVAARVRKWPGRTIPYHETIPAKWDWSLDQAVAHWNESGGRIKFVEVPKRKAKLLISYGDTGGADGVGTLGYQYRNFVYLSPSYKKADEHNAETRVWVGRLFTHELGHVLGFDHTPGQCALMYPVYDFGVCETLPPDKPGYYNCRWIDKKLLRRFTQMYGGKPKRPPKVCLIEALPGPLRTVTFTGGNGQNKPVKVTWVPPATVRDGTKVYVTVWKGASCSAAPDTWEQRVGMDPKAGSWTDPVFGQGTWCYLIHIENRYGAALPATGRALARYAPVPAAPAVGTPTWRPQDGGWRFTWSPPLAGMDLLALRNSADRGQCAPTIDLGEIDHLDRIGASTWHLVAVAPDECVKLYVVTDWGTVSPMTQVDLVVPSSPAAPTPGPRTWNPDSFGFNFTWAPPDGWTTLHAIRDFDSPGTCPTTYDADAAEWLGRENDGRWLLSAYDASECVSLFAVTSWGTVSARTQITTQVPPPTATPVVGTVGPWSGDPLQGASATVTLVDGPSYHLGSEVVQGACPVAPPADATWSDAFEDWGTPGRYVFYPEPYGDTGPQCVMFAAVDTFGQPGPLVKKAFTVPGG